MTIERLNVGKRLSDVVINRASGTAYLAGQVADEPGADITGQTQQVLAQIGQVLTDVAGHSLLKGGNRPGGRVECLLRKYFEHRLLRGSRRHGWSIPVD